MVSDMATSYDVGFIDGMKRAKEMMLRRDVNATTIRWITDTIKQLQEEME